MDWQLKIYSEVTSTQDVLRNEAMAGEPEGAAVMALSQNAGRGRMGRRWQTGTGRDLALSMLLRPEISMHSASLTGFLAAVAVAQTVKKLSNVTSQVRWPNDVLCGGKKIAGILPEGMIVENKIRWIIVGVGLNVNSVETDFLEDYRWRATSLSMATGQTWEIETVARTLLHEFGELYDRMKTEGPNFIVPLWQSYWAHEGAVLVREGISGIAEGVNPDGSLRLRTADWSITIVSSGEVLPPGELHRIDS